MDKPIREILEQLESPADQIGLVILQMAASGINSPNTGAAPPNSFGAGLTCGSALIRL